MINAIPSAKGISERFAPHDIFSGKRLNINHLKSLFGEYIEASVDADVTNDMKGRTHPCISLGPRGNCQGSQIFFDLETGKVVLRQTITILPMPERVIKVIHDWGNLQKTAGFKNNLEFWYRMKNQYDWENEDLYVSDGKVEIKPVKSYPHKPAEIPGVLLESDL